MQPSVPEPFDFDAAVSAPFRMQPGLRPLPPGARQLHALDPHGPAFAAKLAVLSTDPGSALLCSPDFDPRPALTALADEAARQAPAAIVRDSDRTAAPRLGCSVDAQGRLSALDRRQPEVVACVAALPPEQRLAALLSLALHEDFAIVDGRQATLPWLAVCLPSHWAPADKIGRPFATVHAPVPDASTLLAASRALARLVCDVQRWQRHVWNVCAQDGYDQHPARRARPPWPRDPKILVERAWWRTETQSFLPLPARQQAVFAIQVRMQPLTQAIATASQAAALQSALATMSDAVLTYRGLTDARPALLDWLAERAQTPVRR